MKLLINFGPLKKGGGQNVALNFIQALQRKKNLKFDIYFVVCEKSMIKEVLIKTIWADKIVFVSENPIVRIFQELTFVKKFIIENKINVVYTYFGFGLFGKKVKQVIGSADSNLYFPEIDFWSTEKPLEKLKRYCIDKYRIYGLEAAAGVIFENKAMFERADVLFKIKSKKLILPSIDKPGLVEDLNTSFNKNTYKILMLCGWQRNKNILLIPELAHKLSGLGFNVEFIITVDKDDSSCSRQFFELVEQWGTKDYINCIGSVSKGQLPQLYSQVDQVLLLSLLESFSNNIIESWYFQRPLIISDELWSKSICKKAAYYVPRNNINEIAKAIMHLSQCKSSVEKIVNEGNQVLSQFPDVNIRLENELIYLESIYV